MAELEAQIVEYRRRAEVAEARADERERIIQAQAFTLRMLEAAPVPATEDQLPAEPPPTVAGTSVTNGRHEPDSALTWLRRRILG